MGSYDNCKMTPSLKKIIIYGSGGPFLDGYVLVIVGTVLAQLKPELHLSEQWNALIGAAALVGIFFGTLIFGYVTDLVGRRIMFIVDMIAIASISVISMFVHTALELVILRFLIGIVIGADYPIATSLVTEFTPTKYRALSVGFISAVWYVGATFADIVGYLLIAIPGGWRWMLGSSAIPCLIILLGRWGTPESPRWLVCKGRVAEATAVVKKIFGPDAEVDLGEQIEKTRYAKLFTSRYLGRVIFVGVIWACEVVPMFSIYTFGPQILSAFGIGEGRAAMLGDIIISLFFLIGCIPAMFWLNSIGRRPLIIWSFAIMTLSLLVLGIWPNAMIWLIVAMFGIYAFFSGGPAILQWLYPNELFPTDVRASGVGVAMAFSRIGTVVSTYGMPLILSTYGIGPTMFAGVAISAIGLLISIAMAPETKGLTLQETSSLKMGRRF
ncbi:MFS transporter [Desulfitobacterium sp. AusDCA]|uniref:MFS transporter n=1 Tax=Desulfitobacterium sp. AusDCA TaxID=3240383 RepID=UPI003DA75ECE